MMTSLELDKLDFSNNPERPFGFIDIDGRYSIYSRKEAEKMHNYFLPLLANRRSNNFTI